MVESTHSKQKHGSDPMTRPTLLLLAALVSAPAALAAQSPMNLDELVNRRGVYLHPQTLEPFSGAVTRYEEGAMRERGSLQNGRWHGTRETFYLDGKLEARETYREGIAHGPFESFFRTGRPSDKGTYENGELEGAYEAYWSRTQGDIHAAHANAAAAGAAAHEMHEGMDMRTMPGDLMERGTWADGKPCGEWYRFLPRNSQGTRIGGTVQYPPCPST
jgi:antitoxin component YwqK of YwqJK toxin-antitoxin module